ncbi:hypothetical protein L1987_51281 [Smallanthus sonchifolius]|uniref:Uncharacterized protein n=1 Tax=Smallanthus sonchifolius TaxID=185202 RepID=A0ACB9EQH9_9ASTR|nr:hypothetical protein L1987_51281 [Smallanthus sonchifolius]
MCQISTNNLSAAGSYHRIPSSFNRTYLKKQLCNRKKFLTMSMESGSLTLGDLLLRMSKHKKVGENLTEDERVAFLHDSYQNLGDEVDFELFLKS